MRELKKQWKNEYQRRYHLAHREEILAQHKAKYSAKKAVKDGSFKDVLDIKLAPGTERGWYIPKLGVQDVYICDFYSKQLARIEKVLWWIAFAISFVGVIILFK